jgi:hypothetical protein
VQVPELLIEEFVLNCSKRYTARSDIEWSFNILLQNIDVIPSKEMVDEIRTIGNVTCTTAHKSYSDKRTADRLGCDVHFLSTFVCPERYELQPFGSKKDIIVVSKDVHPLKDEIVAKICAELSDYKIIEIKNMTYREYRDTIREAKFTFTFGEGLDLYFIETIFCGGVSMAIYNDRFFTEKYRGLPGVFVDGATAIEAVVGFLRDACEEREFERISKEQREAVSEDYVWGEYAANIRQFYENYDRKEG